MEESLHRKKAGIVLNFWLPGKPNEVLLSTMTGVKLLMKLACATTVPALGRAISLIDYRAQDQDK